MRDHVLSILITGAGGDIGRRVGAHPEGRSAITRQTPLGRPGSAGEGAPAVRLIVADDASYLTGTTLLIDGGSGGGLG